EHTFTIDNGDVRLPRGIHLLRAIPAQVHLSFEPSETHSVPVEVRLSGGLPPDLQVLGATPDPATLTISGPASHVSDIPFVQTDPIQPKPEIGITEYRLEAYVNDPRVRFQESPQVKVKVIVGRK